MKLVDANAVRELLTANVDGQVSGFIIFTQNGTLLAQSQPHLRQSLIKFAPFAGALWRNHAARILNTGNTHNNISGLPGIKTLDFKLGSQGSGLDQVTVEMDGLISVIREIHPRLLLAAQVESTRLRNGTDDGADGVKDLYLSDDSPADSAQSYKTEAEQGSTDDQQSDSDGRQEKQRDRAGHISKLRILELKAEGMAESLALDYPSKLPRDFY